MQANVGAATIVAASAPNENQALMPPKFRLLPQAAINGTRAAANGHGGSAKEEAPSVLDIAIYLISRTKSFEIAPSRRNVCFEASKLVSG
jgi:hypothetical protein